MYVCEVWYSTLNTAMADRIQYSVAAGLLWSSEYIYLWSFRKSLNSWERGRDVDKPTGTYIYMGMYWKTDEISVWIALSKKS